MRNMISRSLYRNLFLYVTLTLIAQEKIEAVQRRTECDDWANAGECDANPNYMWEHCTKSCTRVEEALFKDIGYIHTFYDLEAKDINGHIVDFQEFRGKVIIIVNVASQCGYTEEHYRELVELHKSLAGYTEKVEILAFPCNQFNFQEPGSAEDIKRFAYKKGVEFRMMGKIDVNGIGAHPVYKFLKKVAGPHNIAWNFATYYVVAPDGEVFSHSNVKPSDLFDLAHDMLVEEL